MKTANEQFKKGDWVATTAIPKNPGQKYVNAHVIKVKKNGELEVEYGSWRHTATIKAKQCKLLKRGQ